jgi:hypothetical protein
MEDQAEIGRELRSIPGGCIPAALIDSLIETLGLVHPRRLERADRRIDIYSGRSVDLWSYYVHEKLPYIAYVATVDDKWIRLRVGPLGTIDFDQLRTVCRDYESYDVRSALERRVRQIAFSEASKAD